MGDYQRSITVRVPPARLFDYLSDLSHLPTYLPRLTEATPTHDDKVEVTAHLDLPDQPAQDVHGEAWMKVKTKGRTLQWGAPGPNDYHGELDVDLGDEHDTSTLTVRLHTEHVDGPSIDDGLTEALQGIARNVERAESR